VFNYQLIKSKFQLNMKKILLLLTISVLFGLFSQSVAGKYSLKDSDILAEASKEPGTWVLTFRGGLNGTQASFRDWQGGGVNTLALTTSAVFQAAYRQGQFGYSHLTNLRYGQAKIDGDYRKTDDLINVRNQFRYFFPNEAWSGLLDINFQSQFDIGRDKDNLIVISEFLSPAYITETLGITYKPANFFNASFGLSLKQTIVNNTTLSERYGLAAGKNFKNEAGATFILNYQQDIWENIRLTSSLETFTSVDQAIDRTDFLFSNELSASINKYLSTNFQFVMLYNADVIEKIQMKQVLSVGLTFRFL
jgi:hypothetical protein